VKISKTKTEAIPLKKTLTSLVVLLTMIAAAALNTQAQSELRLTTSELQPVTSAAASATNSARSQTITNALANLPEADALFYVNAQRIINEVVPKFMPARDLEQMRKAFEEIKKDAGVDPSKVDYLVIAVRFRKPTPELNFQAPEFMVVSSGDFSSESLLTLARGAWQGKIRDEKYADKTLGLITIEPMLKEAEKNPFLKAFTEIGVVALNANTIATGSPSYLRAAIDAGSGKDRITAESLNSLVRDPNVLVSFAGAPWHSFAKSFGMLGTEGNPRAPKCESKIGDSYVALNMDATNFLIRGVSNADNPDTAKIFANLYSGLLRYASSSIKDEMAQSILQGLAINAEGDEVFLNANLSQQMIMDLIKKQMTPKTIDVSEQKTTAPAKPATKKRRGRRR
jgi:hypothetical protein